MAMVSLGIAVAQVADGDSDTDPLPKWYKLFVQHTDEPTLSDIRKQIGQFSEWFPRAGVFIDLRSSQVQPTVDFFVRFKIPVWYPWGAAEESYARQNPDVWGKYVPPAHLLQQAHSFLTRTPAPAALLEDAQSEDRPWEAFFANRALRATGPMPQKKPTLKVFHWERDDNGQLVRTRVLRRLNAETLAEYGRQQKVFDERTNEWDCATEMGELDAEERQAAAWKITTKDTSLLLLQWQVHHNIIQRPRRLLPMLLIIALQPFLSLHLRLYRMAMEDLRILLNICLTSTRRRISFAYFLDSLLPPAIRPSPSPACD